MAIGSGCFVLIKYNHSFVVADQSLSHVQLFGNPMDSRTAAHQASLSSTISQCLLEFMFFNIGYLSIKLNAIWNSWH